MRVGEEAFSAAKFTAVGRYTMLKHFWTDESGAIISAELVLVMTILGIGGITGLVALRDALVAESADLANAIRAVDPSFSYSGTGLAGATTGPALAGMPTAATAGSAFVRNAPTETFAFSFSPPVNPVEFVSP
jgi:hypothetical protein